ncbi:MAG: NUDIX hydrolase [Proteobacteria bacterium]|jgi:8-oxo-dGTP diphosphatase|nr:NUDIX hydrolase [Pseudomonadota bacterium]
MIKRFGESVNLEKKYKHRPGVYAILWDSKDLLVTYQDSPHEEMQLPGGGVDSGEHLLHALHREVLEETGWSISQPKKIGVYRRFAYLPDYRIWAEKVCHIYFARPLIKRSLPLEMGHLAVWMSPLDASRELANDGDKDFIQRYFRLK